MSLRGAYVTNLERRLEEARGSAEVSYARLCEEQQKVVQLREILTDPKAFWDAVYPHITEAGPDLNLADCEAITGWLAASLRRSDG